MMTNKEIIESGELELYVAGLLSDERMLELSELIQNNEEVRREVEQIEAVVMRLAKESTRDSEADFTSVLKKIITQRVSKEPKVVQMPTKGEENEKKVDFKLLSGWAAAILLLVFFGLEFQHNQELEDNLTVSLQEKIKLENRLESQNMDLAKKETIIATVTAQDTKIVQLAGQQIAPESSVKVFWDSKNKRVVLDAKNLPKAPEGMVYQVWSLKLEPLTPTSLGLLEGDVTSQGLYVLENKNLSEGFGITLEPDGGSDFPTLEKLYVLGAVSS